MNACNILLTHFSARYPKFPPEFVVKEHRGSAPIVAVAFDCSRFRIGDMWKLSMYMPAIEQCFMETKEEEGEEEIVQASW